MNPRVLNFLIASAAFFLTAFFTPWWGTGIVAVAFACMIAIFVRDGMNEQGPSRILLRFFQGAGPEPSVLRPLLILTVALIAAVFAGACAGLITSLRKLWAGRR